MWSDPSARSAAPSRRGFTLIEVMVALIVAIIISTALVLFFAGVRSEAARLREQVDTWAVARAVLDAVPSGAALAPGTTVGAAGVYAWQLEATSMAQMLAPYADFFTLNASCPNVAGHGAQSALEGASAQLKAVISRAAGKPVLVKLAPTRDEQSLRQTVRHLQDAGAAGFIACNTLPNGMAALADASLLPASWPCHNGEPVGGYSGSALFDISTFMVRTIRSEAGSDAIIIGVGGIDSPQAARQMLECGANAVQLYTALTYQGAPLIKNLNAELESRN